MTDAEPLSFALTALDEYVSTPDPSFGYTVARTFVQPGYDGYVLKLTSQTWRTADEVNRTTWEHWLIVGVPNFFPFPASAHTALLAITGGSNTSSTPPSGFSISELGGIILQTGTTVAELRMVPNQPLSFSADGESAATFQVPGTPSDDVDLTFRFDEAIGGFAATVGFYDLASVSADPVLAKRDYAVQAISNGTILFDERLDPIGAEKIATLPAGTEIGFFIIPNDTASNFLANPDAYYDPPANSGDIYANRRSPLFSVPNANPGQLDQMVASFRNGRSNFAFEDLTRIPGGNSNNGFNDVKFSVNVELVPVPLPAGSDAALPGRTEDAILAYSFDQYLTTGDETWPALLPMVKSAVRAMDAIQQFVPTVKAGASIDEFVLTGASKRGWTTWLTAAVDAASATPRVKGIVPMVIDVLNMGVQLDHHEQYYQGVTNAIIDGFSYVLDDYTELDVLDRRNTPEGQALFSLIDPYAYRDRLSMPKLLINSTGDEFFVPDSAQFYVNDLPGQTYLRYVPNTGHDVTANSDAAETAVSFYYSVINDLPLPEYSWTVLDNGSTIRVETNNTPLEVKLWQATNYDSRDFRKSVTGIPWTSSPLVDQGGGVYVAHMSQPNIGATAFMIELTFSGYLFPMKLTSPVSVLSAPDQTPVEPWLVPQLVDDVNRTSQSSSLYDLTNVGGTLFFTNYDAAHGRELWKSDGTAAGTVLVADIHDGPSSSYPNNLTAVGGTLFFTAYGGQYGRELWKSDGTTEGTVLVADIRPDSPYGFAYGSYPEGFANLNGTLFFSAQDSDHGRELWKSDGTAEGTMLVADIRPGSPYGYPRGSYPQSLFATGGALFFSAYDDEHGQELWKTDGTTQGTILLADIRTGSPYGYPRSSYPSSFVQVGGTLFFTALDDEHGRELWKTDGTTQGTMLVADIWQGSPYGFPRSSYPESLTNVGGTLFFTANEDEHGRELWKSDGTAEGTMLVADVRPGSPYGYPRSSYPESLVNFGGTLLFTAYDDEHGRELWKSNGTAEGTMLVADIWQGSPYGYPRSSNPGSLVNVSGMLFFAAYENVHGRELWKSDGTQAGTMLAADLEHNTLGSYPYQLTDVSGVVFFTADDGEHGVELWKSDGTAAGASLVADISPGPSPSGPDQLVNVNGTLFFTAFDGTHGRELWKSDGTTEGTMLVADILPGNYGWGSYPSYLTNVGGILYFSAYNETFGRELWKSDGTVEGTVLVKDISSGNFYGSPYSSYPQSLTNVGGTLFFTAYNQDFGRELWKSDGTVDGTVLVANIRPESPYGYPLGSYPDTLANVGGTLFFTAFYNDHGRALWKSDGTAEGTTLIADNPGAGGFYISQPTDVAGTLFFTAWDGSRGTELWKSDGTAEGTVLVKDIQPGSFFGSYPEELTNVGGVLFFTAYNSLLGRELWSSDGTAEGTVPLKNINPGSFGSYPGNLTNVNGLLFFTADDGQHGSELWQSDGTSGGTVMVADLHANGYFGFGSYPRQLTNVGGTLFFAANDAQHGTEPWLLIQPVDLDVRPGNGANTVNPTSRARVPVAVLGSESFDVSQIDVSTLTLAGARVAVNGSGKAQFSIEDVNDDGHMDLLLQFVAADMQLAAGQTEVLLEGKLLNGQRIRGSDTIRVVGPANNANPGQGHNKSEPLADAADFAASSTEALVAQSIIGATQRDDKSTKGSGKAGTDASIGPAPAALAPSTADRVIVILTDAAYDLSEPTTAAPSKELPLGLDALLGDHPVEDALAVALTRGKRRG